MNRVYKTIWNEKTGTYVAVSELSHARGKRSGSSVQKSAVFVKQDVRYFMQQTLIFPPFRHRPLLGLTRLH